MLVQGHSLKLSRVACGVCFEFRQFPFFEEYFRLRYMTDCPILIPIFPDDELNNTENSSTNDNLDYCDYFRNDDGSVSFTSSSLLFIIFRILFVIQMNTLLASFSVLNIRGKHGLKTCANVSLCLRTCVLYPKPLPSIVTMRGLGWQGL